LGCVSVGGLRVQRDLATDTHSVCRDRVETGPYARVCPSQQDPATTVVMSNGLPFRTCASKLFCNQVRVEKHCKIPIHSITIAYEPTFAQEDRGRQRTILENLTRGEFTRPPATFGILGDDGYGLKLVPRPGPGPPPKCESPLGPIKEKLRVSCSGGAGRTRD
jgi:hypothetical protein